MYLGVDLVVRCKKSSTAIKHLCDYCSYLPFVRIWRPWMLEVAEYYNFGEFEDRYSKFAYGAEFVDESHMYVFLAVTGDHVFEK